LVESARRGDEQALSALMPLVYDELRRLAASYMRRERPGQTLQATALVHDAYIRLMQDSKLSWQNRSHFFGIAARSMRQILVERARARRGPRALRGPCGKYWANGRGPGGPPSVAAAAFVLPSLRGPFQTRLPRLISRATAR